MAHKRQSIELGLGRELGELIHGSLKMRINCVVIIRKRVGLADTTPGYYS